MSVQRDEVVAHVQANPGARLGDVMRALAVSKTVALRILEKLAGEGLVARERLFGYTCWFAAGTPREVVGRRQHELALQPEAAVRILHDLCRNPGTSFRDTQQRTGLAPSVVSYHIDRLETAGLVQRLERHATLALVATPVGFQVMARGKAAEASEKPN
jgi:DNA-binding MarR family transcriptional regulator